MSRNQNAPRDAAQPADAQPRPDDDEVEQPENAPSFLTAQELLAREPAKGAQTGEKHASAFKERRSVNRK